MLKPVDCDKSPMYIATPRAISMQTTERYALRNTMNNSRQNLVKYSSNKQEGKERNRMTTTGNKQKTIIKWQT